MGKPSEISRLCLYYGYNEGQGLTYCSHTAGGQVGLFDAPSSPVGRQYGLVMAEGAVGIATGQLAHRVAHNAVRLQAHVLEQVDLSDLCSKMTRSEGSEKYSIVHCHFIYNRRWLEGNERS